MQEGRRGYSCWTSTALKIMVCEAGGLCEDVGKFRDADAHDGPREDERARDKLGRVVDLERRSGLEVVLGPSDVRVVVADQERLARLGEQARREEEADAAQGWRGCQRSRLRGVYKGDDVVKNLQRNRASKEELGPQQRGPSDRQQDRDCDGQVPVRRLPHNKREGGPSL